MGNSSEESEMVLNMLIRRIGRIENLFFWVILFVLEQIMQVVLKVMNSLSFFFLNGFGPGGN